MQNYINEQDNTTPLVLNLPPSILRRRSIEDPLRDTHTHRALPVLKRSATTTPNGRARSYRFPEVESLQPLTTMAGTPMSHWASPGSPGASSGRTTSFLDTTHERPKMRRSLGTDSASVNSEQQRVAEISVVEPEPDSPEDGTNFRRSLEINMKDLVGDAVGNMSISPSSRDIVLAARKGLFIIDLENPLEVPRFLPQGGTWDVADVQWNPHSSRSQYIVSTSSEKMLIWNLDITGKTSIQHILRSHYRAITDFNWHTTEPDLVASTGIDSWIFIWDIRNPRKPSFALSAFQDSGTQVKWNRQDAHFLASAHGNEVLIWDRRKGSLPVTRIQAHQSKIYGIDWSHHLRNEIVTCSLDKSIKTWDTNAPHSPNSCIETDYPRGETRLEMFARGERRRLVETFDGHRDVVKEFVWRRGMPDEFQLISWSKDRTLRFWPVSAEVMQNVGYTPEPTRGRSHLRLNRETTISYRNPPETKPFHPILSAPIGNRGILAEVRALPPPRTATSANHLITQPHLGSSARGTTEHPHQSQLTPTLLQSESKPIAVTRTRGGTMSRGAVTGKSVARMDALVWLSNVKVGNDNRRSRGGSSGAGSVGGAEGSGSEDKSKSRVGSGSRGGSVGRESDEITSVLGKLASSKVKTEKIDLTKKRTCTLGLHGPWGERSSVFVRITFTFPPKYPSALHPEGTPTIELERSPLISIRDRAYMLKRLRAIRERKRPCLEACLRFLLFGEEDRGRGVGDSESSEEEDEREGVGKEGKGEKGKEGGKEFTVSILRNHKNLAEPRTSQGTFGPNGELICFFRAPPRIVRNVLRGLSDASPKANVEEQQPPAPVQAPADPQQQQQQTQQSQSRLFQSPALVSDAIRRLSLAAKDRTVPPIDPRKPENDLNILRTMTNLLTVSSQHKVRRDSIASGMSTANKNWSLLPTRRSNVFMMDTTNIEGPDRVVGVEYVVQAGITGEEPEKDREGSVESGGNVFGSEGVAAGVVLQLYSDLSKAKDIQMLAMLSVIILQTPYASTAHLRIPAPIIPIKTALDIPIGARLPPIKTGFDYFSLARSINNAPSPMSPAQWPSFGGANSAGTGTPSPVGGGPPIAPPSVASSNSSRGSWSSLFNPQHVRQFVSGVQDSIKDGLITPSEVPASAVEAQMLAVAKMNEKAVNALGGGGGLGGGGVGPATAGGGGGGLPGGPGFSKPNPTTTAALGAAFAANIAGSVLAEKRNKRRVRKDSSMHSTATAHSGSTGTTHSLNTSYPPSTRNSSVVSRSWNEGQQVPLQPRRSLSGSFSSSGPSPRYYVPQFPHQRSLRSVVKLREAEKAFREKQRVIFEPAIVEESSQPLFSPEILQQMRRHVLIYAELLFRWQLYNKRVELLNAIDRPRAELEREEEQHRIGLMRMCPRPDCRMLLDAKTRSCLQCNASAPLPRCTICRLPVKDFCMSPS
ncbi:hypothetical protein MD484_g8411, partial [Candolleomyces efflorescens]